MNGVSSMASASFMRRVIYGHKRSLAWIFHPTVLDAGVHNIIGRQSYILRDTLHLKIRNIAGGRLIADTAAYGW